MYNQSDLTRDGVGVIQDLSDKCVINYNIVDTNSTRWVMS